MSALLHARSTHSESGSWSPTCPSARVFHASRNDASRSACAARSREAGACTAAARELLRGTPPPSDGRTERARAAAVPSAEWSADPPRARHAHDDREASRGARCPGAARHGLEASSRRELNRAQPVSGGDQPREPRAALRLDLGLDLGLGAVRARSRAAAPAHPCAPRVARSRREWRFASRRVDSPRARPDFPG